MDCKNDCQNYKPVWTPPVARFKPNKPLPDGAVCVASAGNDGYIYDWYMTREGKVVGRSNEDDADTFAYEPIELVPAIRDLGLPVWGVDLNRNGETAEEFWTDKECMKRLIQPDDRPGQPCGLPCAGLDGDTEHRMVTLLRRYHGKRKDGVSVDGWIVKPVAASVAKPEPTRPECADCCHLDNTCVGKCPSHLPPPAPPPPPPPPAPRKDAVQENPPFKVGDWVTDGGGWAWQVGEMRCNDGVWQWYEPRGKVWSPCSWHTLLRPAPLPGATPASRELPPLPGAVRQWMTDGECGNTGCAICSGLRRCVREFIRSLYPHEFKD